MTTIMETPLPIKFCEVVHSYHHCIKVLGPNIAIHHTAECYKTLHWKVTAASTTALVICRLYRRSAAGRVSHNSTSSTVVLHRRRGWLRPVYRHRQRIDRDDR